MGVFSGVSTRLPEADTSMNFRYESDSVIKIMQDNDVKPFESSSSLTPQEQSEKLKETATRPIDELIEFLNCNCPDCSYNPDAPEKVSDKET